MTDFDAEVRPILHRILGEAQIVEAHSDAVTRDVKDLPARPHWITKAEDALEQAELSLQNALRHVKAAREHYRKVRAEEV